MTEYTITKEKILEVMTRIPAEIRLFRNIETGKITGELIIEQAFFGDFNLDESDMACTPNDPTWKTFFEHKFDKFDSTDVIKNNYKRE